MSSQSMDTHDGKKLFVCNPNDPAEWTDICAACSSILLFYNHRHLTQTVAAGCGRKLREPDLYIVFHKIKFQYQCLSNFQYFTVMFIKLFNHCGHAIVPQLNDAAVQWSQHPWSLGVKGKTFQTIQDISENLSTVLKKISKFSYLWHGPILSQA